MSITIDNTNSIGQVQKAFMALFPFLRIEFYSRGHGFGKGTWKKEILPKDIHMGDFVVDNNLKSITIHGQMKVSELERAFATNFGLPVQVFRKVNDGWLQTITTDYWSLDEQNQSAKGRSAKNIYVREEFDYHEQL